MSPLCFLRFLRFLRFLLCFCSFIQCVSVAFVRAKMAAVSSSSTDCCSICMDDVSNGCGRTFVKLQCSHQFHLDCIGSAFNVKGVMECPNCRRIEDGVWRCFENGSPEEDLFEGTDYEETVEYIDMGPLGTYSHRHPGWERELASLGNGNVIDLHALFAYNPNPNHGSPTPSEISASQVLRGIDPYFGTCEHCINLTTSDHTGGANWALVPSATLRIGTRANSNGVPNDFRTPRAESNGSPNYFRIPRADSNGISNELRIARTGFNGMLINDEFGNRLLDHHGIRAQNTIESPFGLAHQGSNDPFLQSFQSMQPPANSPSPVVRPPMLSGMRRANRLRGLTPAEHTAPRLEQTGNSFSVPVNLVNPNLSEAATRGNHHVQEGIVGERLQLFLEDLGSIFRGMHDYADSSRND